LVAADNAFKAIEHHVGQSAGSESRVDRDLLRNSAIHYRNRLERAAIDFAGGHAQSIQEVGPRAKPVGTQLAAFVA